jgi:hypothetical protein
MSLRKLPSTCLRGRRRTPLCALNAREIERALLRPSQRLATIDYPATGSAVRNRDVSRDHPRPSTIGNVCGSAVRNRGPPIRDYFPKKAKSDLTGSSSQRLGGKRAMTTT